MLLKHDLPLWKAAHLQCAQFENLVEKKDFNPQHLAHAFTKRIKWIYCCEQNWDEEGGKEFGGEKGEFYKLL
jgi:hypothetical protein